MSKKKTIAKSINKRSDSLQELRIKECEWDKTFFNEKCPKYEEFIIINGFLRCELGEWHNIDRIERFFLDESTTNKGYVFGGISIYISINDEAYQIKRGYKKTEDATKDMEKIIKLIRKTDALTTMCKGN
jgi:hypothetical protein